jgi:hypothetical protein
VPGQRLGQVMASHSTLRPDLKGRRSVSHSRRPRSARRCCLALGRKASYPTVSF